jgi:inosine-uridine nucleoside N-ribohydrolase
MERDVPVFRGSAAFLKDESTPVDSDAARDLARRVLDYSPEAPLYIVAIGAITNVASALLMAPEIKEKMVLVWLGGHSQDWPNTMEFNMYQDVAGARVVFGCGVPLIQLPCGGIVEAFAASGPELEYWLKGKNALCDYLVEHTAEAANAYAAGKVWSRVIWDVTAVGWLMNEGDRFMQSKIIPAAIPEYDHHYGYDYTRHPMRYVWHINRDALMQDLFSKLAGK